MSKETDLKRYIEEMEKGIEMFCDEFKNSSLNDLLGKVDMCKYKDKMRKLIDEHITKKDITVKNDKETNWFFEFLKDRSFDVNEDGIYLFDEKISSSKRLYRYLRLFGLKYEKLKLQGDQLNVEFNFVVYDGEKYYCGWFELFNDTALYYANNKKELFGIGLMKKFKEIKMWILKRMGLMLPQDEKEDLKKKAENLCLSYKDFIDAGNCRISTLMFISYFKDFDVDLSNDCLPATYLFDVARLQDLPLLKKSILKNV